MLQVKNLKTYFYTPAGIIKAVDDISFEIEKGEVLGLVGESGSGKTLTALSILKLIQLPAKIVDGQVIFNGRDILCMDEKYMRSIRGSKISIVFQDPLSAFNPVFTIGYQITEAVSAHQKVTKILAKDIAIQALRRVHVKEPEKIYYDYPHQISGGMRERAAIAMALVNSPELLILDEPTTALDVTIQAQVLDLLKEIIDRDRMTVLFISHDFGVIARMCDHVGVMQCGKIVETGKTREILNNPKENYTISLLESVKALA
jgi:ABC-type dipeptide/oligopeptide/nickel transport system ATPase component